MTLALAPQAHAENTLISPQEAEELVRAQMEELKAAAALQEEAAAEAVRAAPSGKAANAAVKKKATEEAPEDANVEETASLPDKLPVRARFERTDVAKAQALKPLITRYAAENGLPYELADAVVRLESRYNSAARRGPNVGLTQINVRSAQSLGYRGDAAGLLDAETNLRYGLKYLAAAYKIAGGDTCGAILRYQFGLRANTMNGASRAYCAKVKVLTAAAD